MTLVERLRALGQRRDAEGIYTDQNICEAAIEAIERLNTIIDDFKEGHIVRLSDGRLMASKDTIADLNEKGRRYAVWAKRCVEHGEEIERLRGEIESWKALVKELESKLKK